MPEKTTPMTVSSLTRLFSFRKPVAMRAGHAGGEGADRERQADDIGEHDAGQHGMGDRVAHQRPALEHQEAGQQRHGGGDQDRDQQRLLHEGESERQKQHRAMKPSLSRPPALLARRRRAASIPCFGAKHEGERGTSASAGRR